MIQKAKGTYDVYGEMGRKIQYLEQLWSALMDKYHYQYIRTPIFEASELFHRGVGETSDIISKETYDFQDRGDRRLTLRPEGTAGVVRSFIENKLYAIPEQPMKAWYFGAMYRYERPQSGRFREFYQFGVEAFGSTDPGLDAEVISIPVNFYRLLGLKGIKVHINTLGDIESRIRYKEALVTYFKPHIHELCEDCQRRLEKNPLRILDCKVDSNSEIMMHVPNILDYLNEESRIHFEKVKESLEALQIEYLVTPNLVRGLDYYTHTIFEVEASIEGFGSQNILCGGGRYDGLVKTLGGKSTPGVGFALGLERLLTALDYENIHFVEESKLDIYIIPVEDVVKPYAQALVQTLRLNGFSCDIDYMQRNVKANFKQSERFHAQYIILIGEDEKETKELTVKDNKSKVEFKVKEEDIVMFFDERIGNDK